MLANGRYCAYLRKSRADEMREAIGEGETLAHHRQTLEALAERMGIKQKLEDAGVRIMAQTCLVISPLVGGYKKLITDSGKFASYLPSEHNIDIRYAETEKCVEAVTE